MPVLMEVGYPRMAASWYYANLKTAWELQTYCRQSWRTVETQQVFGIVSPI